MAPAPKRDTSEDGLTAGENAKPRVKKGREVSHLSDEVLAGYIAETLTSLYIMTEKRNLNFLGYLLEMAVQEASNVRKKSK